MDIVSAVQVIIETLPIGSLRLSTVKTKSARADIQGGRRFRGVRRGAPRSLSSWSGGLGGGFRAHAMNRRPGEDCLSTTDGKTTGVSPAKSSEGSPPHRQSGEIE